MRGENLYREVLLQIEQNSCQEVEIDAGSLSNVTIKTDGHTKSGAGGGFAYKDTTRVESFGRNRFIHWYKDLKCVFVCIKLLLFC